MAHRHAMYINIPFSTLILYIYIYIYIQKNRPVDMTDIDILASELDVRREIAGVIVNSGEEFSSCSRHSFEFIEANGKNLCVLQNPWALSGLAKL